LGSRCRKLKQLVPERGAKFLHLLEKRNGHAGRVGDHKIGSPTPLALPKRLSQGQTCSLDRDIETLCANILQAPAIATDGVKDYVRHALTMDVPAAIDYARNLHAVVNSSREIRGKR
jgi:hypothetical protein